MITALGFSNYKIFEKQANLPLKPITVLIGKNNAGKSAVARLPLLLAHALSDRADHALDLKFDNLDFGTSLVGLIYGKTPNRNLGLHMSLTLKDGTPLGLFWTMIWDPETQDQLIYEFKVDYKNQKKSYRISLESYETYPPGDFYEDTSHGPLKPVQIDFSGLKPTLAKNCEFLETVVDQLKEVSPRVTSLGPIRSTPNRRDQFPDGEISHVGRMGETAPQMLGRDFAVNDSKLLKAVAAWFEPHLEGWKFDLDRHKNQFALVLRDQTGTAVDLADAGMGVTQALPIVVQRCYDQIHGKAPELEIVEQPELHMHPAAHGDLADLFVTGAKHQGRFIIETHSENLLLRLRRRVAEFRGNPEEKLSLNPDDLIFYWLDPQKESEQPITQIHIDEEGATYILDQQGNQRYFWPKDVFSENFHEVRAIRRASQRMS